MYCHRFDDVEALPASTNEEIVQKYRKGMEMHPEAKPYFLRQLAFHYYDIKKPDLAIAAHYERIACYEGKEILEMDDRHHLSEAFTSISRDFNAKGKFDLAFEYLKKNFELEGDKLGAMAMIARFYEEQKDYKKAEECYFQLLEIPKIYGPQYNHEYYSEAGVYSLLANFYVKIKDYKKAISFHEKRLELESKNNNKHGYVLSSLAYAYSFIDKEKEYEYTLKAIEWYEKGVADYDNGVAVIDPLRYDTTAAYVLPGYFHCLKDLYSDINNKEKAAFYNKRLGEIHQKAYEDPLGNSKDYHESCVADSLVEEGKFKEALAIYLKQLKEEEYEDNKPGHYKKIAETYTNAKNIKKAIKYYLLMLEMDEDDYHAILGLAVIYQDEKRYDLAKPYLERYIELCPNKNARAYSALANCINEKEEPVLFISLLKKAGEINDDKDESYACSLYCIMGKIHWNVLKDAESALTCFRKMMTLNPSEENIGEAGLCVFTMSTNPEAVRSAMKYMTEFMNVKKGDDHRPVLTPEEIKALPYHYLNFPEDFMEQQNYIKKFKEDFEKDLESNPLYKEFFEKYDSASIPDFRKAYVNYKLTLVSSGKYYGNSEEPGVEVFLRLDAEKVFKLILQKKLFNMQVLWRAENLTIPEVEIIYDFECWSERIMDCPFIEDVTPGELSVMKQFLMDSNFSDGTNWWFHSWQDYEELIQQNNDGHCEYMPEWYDFYDGRMGTGALLLLPDKRGPKESAYISKFWEWKNNQPRQVPEPYTPVLQPLHPTENAFSEFINSYENDYFNLILQQTQEEKKFPEETFDVSEIWSAIAEFRKSKTPIYLNGGMEWHEAILTAARKMKNAKIANRLDGVYEDYIMKRQLQGLHIGDTKNGFVNKLKDNSRAETLERILKGRELSGEPSDLNF